MIITRKIQIYISESDPQYKKEFIQTLYEWRRLVRQAANIVVSHKFTQENIKDFIYLKDEVKEKFYVKDIIKDEKGMSEQNTTYRVLSDILKGKIPSDIYSCLNQSVSNTYKETKGDIYIGKASLRSYKNNIPIPFSAKALSNIHWESESKRFYFTLFGIPFATALGSDRSNNKLILDRCINGEYKLCSSSIQIDDSKKKTFLLLCVDIPKKNIIIKEDSHINSFLSIVNPIVAHVVDGKIYEIGTKEEFMHRRIQIQESLRRCQINSKYTNGGRGRKKKLQAIDRFHKAEKNYVDTKLHIYSRELVNLAVKNECGVINLVNQKQKEEQAKENEFILRNWSYYGLKQKIEYKAKMYGIEVKEIEI